MCGIAGYLGPRPPEQDAVTAAFAELERRGPDGRGLWRGAVAGHYLVLLHTRLAIVDLDPRANQPFEDDACLLVFNGEIYNHRELRDELTALGERFRTLSDTEVVLKAYRHWGRRCVDRFEGMWAFALANRETGELLLSRDRFGEKPLLTRQADGGLTFASTVGALEALDERPATVDERQVRRLLVNGYKSINKARRSFYTDVLDIPAAHQAVITNPEVIHPAPYWRLCHEPAAMSEAEAAEGARERLFSALEHRLRADVPVAFCLSGGIDSGTLTGLAARHFGYDVHAFSILDEDPRYAETENIEKVAADIGCPIARIRPTHGGFFDRMERLVAERGRPAVTLSAYMENFLAEAIGRHGYKVALTGVGADELFTGYYDHYAFWLAQRAGSAVFPGLLADWRHSYGAHVRNPYLQDPEALAANPGQRDHIYLGARTFASYLTEPFDEPFTERVLATDLLRNRMLNEIADETVPVMLQEGDANFMGWSVENRAPYLDRALAEFLFTVPGDYLVRDGLPKWLLRNAAEGFLTDEVRLSPRKYGFNVSLATLIDPADPATRDRILGLRAIYDLVDRAAVERLLAEAPWPNSVQKFLFNVVSAGLFLESRKDAGAVGQQGQSDRMVA